VIEKIGAYKILGMLSQGSRPLYKAAAKDGRQVALKTMPSKGVSDEEKERFKREAEVCATLDHPNLVRVFDSGEADGYIYQAMELLEGADLARVMGENRPFTWEDKISIMEQVCDGLQYAHARNMVHRDIKPENMFLENSGRVRLLDFGMVRVESSNLTQAGSTMGTLNYMSPEQVRGGKCTAASDVFSAGIVFFQLITGRHPFSTRTSTLPQILSAIVFEAPPSMKSLTPDAPEGMEFVVLKALEKEPVKRWQNAGDFKQAIGFCRLTLGISVAAAAAAPAAPPAGPTRPQSPGEPDFDPSKTVVRHVIRPAAPVPPPAAPPKRDRPSGNVRPTVSMEYAFCPTCTSANPKGAALCSKCGTPLGPPTGQTVLQQGSSKNWAILTIIAVLVIVLLVLLVALFTNR
jgi:eukaryotic-like serine/threonine-protein kinase